MKVPFWLPHEVVGTLFQANGSALLHRSVLDRAALRHLQETSAKMACQSSDVLGLGLWMDATPFNRDRSKSLEIVSLNFPGLDTDLRILICAIPKDFISKNETYDEIMAIVAWSFQQLYKGQYPSSRHDGSKWGNSDACRKKKVAPPCQGASSSKSEAIGLPTNTILSSRAGERKLGVVGCVL